MGAMTGDPEYHPLGLPYSIAPQLSTTNKLFTTVVLNQNYTFPIRMMFSVFTFLTKEKKQAFTFVKISNKFYSVAFY